MVSYYLYCNEKKNKRQDSFPQEKRGSFTLPLLLMGLTGLEPVTPALSTQCSNQLSYAPSYLKSIFYAFIKNKAGDENRTHNISLEG